MPKTPKIKIYHPDPVKKSRVLDEIEHFFDLLELKYGLDIKYNVDKITRK